MLRAPICRLNQRMASTSLLVLFLLAVFTTDVHSEDPKVLKGSTAVLTPGHLERSIISISWKHGGNLAAEWFGGSPTFYHIFKDSCSLNTETGELTINEVRLEHSGVYTPEINNRILTDIRLQVLSPVPKPSIIFCCNSEETLCALTCVFNKTHDLGDVQVFWILDDGRVKEGSELSITKETKEKTFICRLKNPVSSESSTELINPLLPDQVLIILQVVLGLCILIPLVVLVCCCIRKLQKVQRLNEELEIERHLNKFKSCPDEMEDLEKERHMTRIVDIVLLCCQNAFRSCLNRFRSCLNKERSPPNEERSPQNEDEGISLNGIKTDEDAENLNKDPSVEVNHATGSGSAENDPPETERAEASSGSPDGGISTSEPS